MSPSTRLLIGLGIIIMVIITVAQIACKIDERVKVRKWKRMGFTPAQIESLKAQHFS